MRMIKLLVVLILSFFCIKTNAEGMSNNNPFAIASKTYIINRIIDLNNQTVTIPAGSVVVFKNKGQIKNGTIEGDGAYIKAGRHLIFNQVLLKGCFSAKTAYSEWFDIQDDCVLDERNRVVSGTNNLQAFKNLLLFDNVSIKKGYYLVEGGVLSCRSNQVINGNNAILKFLTKKNCFSIDGSDAIPVTNVKIKNLKIVGCKQDYGDMTEWWHGVYVGFSKDVLIENVICDQCRGDGFYIGTRINRMKDVRIPINITLKKVKALNSHRNGLSITRAINVKVFDSEFGFTSGTLPETGIDIEPNKVIKDNEVINVGELENISISNCKFYGNGNEGFLIANQISTKPTIRIIKNVQVSDCSFDDDDITLTGCEDCTLERLFMHNSKVRVNGESIIKNLTLTGFRMVETEEGNDETAIDLQYYRSIDWPVRSNIVISDMKIDGYGGAAIFVGQGNLITYKKFDGLTISGCTIQNCGEGIKIGRSVKNLRFYNNKIDGKPISSESLMLMSIPVCMFLLLITGGLTFYIKRKYYNTKRSKSL